MSSSILPDHLSRSQNDLVRISVVIHDLQRPVLIHILNNNSNIIRLLNNTIDAENVADVTRKKERREDTINEKHKQNDKQIKNNKKPAVLACAIFKMADTTWVSRWSR